VYKNIAIKAVFMMLCHEVTGVRFLTHNVFTYANMNVTIPECLFLCILSAALWQWQW